MSKTILQAQAECRAYKFYKYRTTHASGRSYWHIIRLPEGEDPKFYFDELGDGIRKVEYQRIKLPPKEWLEQEILDMRERANEINSIADNYCWIYENYDTRRSK